MRIKSVHPGLIFLLLYFAFICPARAQDSTVTQNKVVASNTAHDSVTFRSPTGAMLRSMFVPGWGQWYNGKRFKAVLIAGGHLGLIADAIVQNQLAVRANDELERAYYQDNRSLAIWWLLGLTLYSMADAYVDAHLFGFDESTDLSLRPAIVAEQFSLALVYTIRF